MKNLYSLLALFFLVVTVWAQSPQKMSYQAVVRNNDNSLVINQPVGVKISVLQGTDNGSTVYSELFNPNPETNANGLLTLEIGGGIPVSGTFSEIDWSKGPFFIRTEIDPSGGSNYTVTGTTSLLSVPFALHAQSVENDKVDDADNDPANEIQQLNLSGSTLSLSKGGGSVTLPTSGEGGSDNWGTQSVVSDATLDGAGTSASPLKLADNAVTSAKIADGAVTGSKIESGAISSDKIESGAVTGTKIAQSGASSGQVLKWDGSQWSPGADESGEGGFSLPYEGSISTEGYTLKLSNTYSSNFGFGIYSETATTEGHAIYGRATGAGFTAGVLGQSISTSGYGVWGMGSTGVYGESSSSYGSGVEGINKSSTGITYGVYGSSRSSDGYGVYGIGKAAGIYGQSDAAFGVYGESTSTGLGGVGVRGKATGSLSAGVEGISDVGDGVYGSGQRGVYGRTNSTSGTGIFGYAFSSTGETIGVRGNVASSNGFSGHFSGGKFYVDGKVGLGTASPVTSLHVRHGVLATNAPEPVEGIRIHNSGANNNSWTLYTVNSNGNLQFYANNELRGTFSATSGTYTSSSNRRLKTDIIAIGEDILKRTLQLEPVSYRFISNPQSEPTIGFIAEDVKPLFPELVDAVGENSENMAINYAAFSVVAIKAIQQQQKQLEALQTENEKLKKRLERLENLVASTAQKGND